MTTSEVTTVEGSRELTTENIIDIANRFARETSRKTWLGELLKFVKSDYLTRQDGDEIEIEPGTKMVAVMPSLFNGWIKWEDKRNVAQEMGYVFEGFMLPSRTALGDNEKGEWPQDEKGAPVDPWARNCLLAMVDENEKIYTFSTGSKGGLGAIGELVRAYGQHARQLPTQIPVIELNTTSYMHPIYKKVHTPVFKVIDWVEQGPFIALLNGGGGDAVAEEPKAKPKATPRREMPMPANAKAKKDGKKHGMRF
jgi:hypothetical protein